MELLLLSHLPTCILEEGLIPAAIELNLEVTVLTDCVREHLVRARDLPVYRQCKLLECDIFNPLSIARLISVHRLEFAGVLATGSELQACAALISEYMGLTGPSWSGALVCDQKAVLRSRLESASSHYRRITNCSGPDTNLDPGLYPLTVQPLENSSVTSGKIARNYQDLKRYLAEIGDGYALVEEHLEGDIYTLDGLGTPDGFVVLCGSRVQFEDRTGRAGRVRSFVQIPPRCDELLALLSKLDLGSGRHHIEYLITDKGIRITDIHNGYQDDASEFVVNGQFDGNLFREAVNICLSLPTQPLKRVRTAESAWLTMPEPVPSKEIPAAFERVVDTDYRILFKPLKQSGDWSQKESRRNAFVGSMSVCGPDQQRAKALLSEFVDTVAGTRLAHSAEEAIA